LQEQEQQGRHGTETEPRGGLFNVAAEKGTPFHPDLDGGAAGTRLAPWTPVNAPSDPGARAGRRVGPLDPVLERALSEVPRELFLAAELAALDRDPGHRIAREGRLLQPVEVAARMIQALDLRPGAKVLELGGGVGYTAAVLARLDADVVSVEEIEPLGEAAARTLPALGVTRVRLLGTGSRRPISWAS
jgi:hypothetical protein